MVALMTGYPRRAGRLEQKVAVITGGGSGIGSALVERFSAEGAAVVVADLSGRRAAQVAERLPCAVAVKADVSVPEDAERIVTTAVTQFGGIDVLVNNAGYTTSGSVLSMPVEEWDRVFAVNVRGGFLCSKFAMPLLREHGGGVVLFTASTDALQGSVGQLAYASSKAAILAMTRTMALDHGPHGIRVNCVCPGATATPPMVAMIEESPAAFEDLLERVPYGRGLLPLKRLLMRSFFLLRTRPRSSVGLCWWLTAALAGIFNASRIER